MKSSGQEPPIFADTKRGKPLKRISLLVLCSAIHLAANAAATLPENLIGSWGTSASLWIGKGPQAELHLPADGLGLFIGSSHEGQRTDGVSDGKPGPRAVMGFPVQITLDGNTLSLRPRGFTERDVRELEGIVFNCSYDAAGPILSCVAPDKTRIKMTRRSETISAEAQAMIEKVRDKVR
jgi:hypothetical protein